MNTKIKTIILSAIILSSITGSVSADTPLGWRGNSFYLPEEDRYTQTKSKEQIEEEKKAADAKKKPLTDILKGITFDINRSGSINEAQSNMNNGSSIGGGNASTGAYVNGGDGTFYSGTAAMLDFRRTDGSRFGPNQFIQLIAPIAMELGIKYSVFPSVLIANAAQETGWGNSSLTVDCNNMGGVKAYSDWTGPLSSSPAPSWEDNGTTYYRGYSSINAALEDKAQVLQASRYDVIRQAKTPYEALKFHATGYAGSSTKDDELRAILDYAPNNLLSYDTEYMALLKAGKINHASKTREDIKNGNY